MNSYSKIISLPHHKSHTRQPMSEFHRAAQFAPFAALSGYDGVLRETARLTEAQAELAEDRKEELNTRLRQLSDCLACTPPVCITFFKPDSYKTGGAYHKAYGTVRQIDTVFQRLLLNDGTEIPLSAITDITGALWRDSV